MVVVGAGPAGSSVAWRLARAGCEVTLLERAHFPREKPCAEYVSPGAIRLLEEMGALGALERAGAVRLDGMMVRAPGGERIVGDFAATCGHADDPAAGGGLAVRRTILDTILASLARQAGATLIEGARVTGLVTDAAGHVRGVEALVDHRPSRMEAELVVGADGLRSVVARRLGLTRRGTLPRRLALVAHFRGVAGLGRYGEMHVERGGYCGMARVGGGESNLSLVVPAYRAPELAGDTAGFMDGWVASHPQLRERYRDAERTGRVIATGPFASRARQVWAPGGGAVLVGDAAGYFDPFTGEGIHAALLGAELLEPHAIRALDALTHRGQTAGERDAHAIRELREYARARRRLFGGGWIVERMIALAVGHPTLMDRAASALSRRRDLADLLVGVTGGTAPASAVLRPAYLYKVFLQSR